MRGLILFIHYRALCFMDSTLFNTLLLLLLRIVLKLLFPLFYARRHFLHFKTYLPQYVYTHALFVLFPFLKHDTCVF